MSLNHILKYRDGYKYQLAESAVISTCVRASGVTTITEFITLTPEGTLLIKEGYAWDGPSGIAIDTKNFMRGSLAHDALYQLMRNGHLAKKWRKVADEELVRICKEDGMWAIRRWWVLRAVRNFGGSSADPKNKKPILTAP